MRTSSMSPRYRASISSHIGAVKGWCELLQRPCARCSLSTSSRVKSGNSATHRKWGSVDIAKSPSGKQAMIMSMYIPKGNNNENKIKPTASLGEFRNLQACSTEGSRPTLVQEPTVNLTKEKKQQKPGRTYRRSARPHRQPYIVPSTQLQRAIYGYLFYGTHALENVRSDRTALQPCLAVRFCKGDALLGNKQLDVGVGR